MLNILSVDVEEYFHPTEVQPFVDPGRWGEYPSRIEEQVDRVLRLFERRGAKATFFAPPFGELEPHNPNYWLSKRCSMRFFTTAAPP